MAKKQNASKETVKDAETRTPGNAPAPQDKGYAGSSDYTDGRRTSPTEEPVENLEQADHPQEETETTIVKVTK